jgi:hypothetical protein
MSTIENLTTVGTDLELVELLIDRHDEVFPLDVDLRVHSARNIVQLTASHILKLIRHSCEDSKKLLLPEISVLIS